MLLQELIDEDLIIMNLKAKDKKGVIRELVELFVKNGVVTDRDDFFNAINKREEIESTGIGNGIAIPHAKAKSVKQIKVALGRATEGIDFEALDELLVYFVFMVAAPQDAVEEYLQAIAKVLRFLRVKTNRNIVLEAKTAKEVINLIKEFDGILPETIKVKTRQGRVIYNKKEK